MFGIKEFHYICMGVNKQRKKDRLDPFKPIFGCEMYVARRGDKSLKETKEDLGGYHLIVLAKNQNGYKNLIKLVSNSWVDGFYNRPRTDHQELEKYHEDLIVCSACIAGEVPAKILKGDIEGARKSIEWHKNLWGDDYYLELQRNEVTDPTIRANRETFPLQQQANKVLIELAKEYGVSWFVPMMPILWTKRMLRLTIICCVWLQARIWMIPPACCTPNRSGLRHARR
jgi:DNA polymerase-3 subunit alpha